jgi:hypothetical protein
LRPAAVRDEAFRAKVWFWAQFLDARALDYATAEVARELAARIPLGDKVVLP